MHDLFNIFSMSFMGLLSFLTVVICVLDIDNPTLHTYIERPTWMSVAIYSFVLGVH